jgi:hypothetical protein
MKLKELKKEVSILSNNGHIAHPETYNGNYSCEDTNLTTLKGAPRIINGSFNCRMNQLKSLKYGPEKVDGEYNCRGNELTSLEGAPKVLYYRFICCENNLTSLKGGPKAVSGRYLANANKISSLEGFPNRVGGAFNCRKNKLTSLEGIHNHVKHIGDIFYLADNPITSHVLGLMLIGKMSMVELDNKQVQEIINKHLAGDRDVFECQQELMEAGLDDFAQL